MTDDLRAVATPLLPCPFCGALLDVHEHSAFHPENECWLEKDVNGWELDEWNYVQWNRRALLARPVDEPQTLPSVIAGSCLVCGKEGPWGVYDTTARVFVCIECRNKALAPPIVPSADTPTKEKL